MLCLMKKGGCDCGAGCTLSEEVLNSRVKDVLRVKARLGLMLVFLKPLIEDEITQYLENHFGCSFT